MIRSQAILAVVGGVAALVLLTPGVADASTAKAPTPFANTRIVLGQSIGGLSLGERQTRAAKRYPSKNCYQGVVCEYDAPGDRYEAFSCSVKARVIEVVLASKNFAGTAERLRTNKGIGIGSYFRQLKRAYPRVHENSSRTFYVLNGKSGHESYFHVRDRRVDAIAVLDSTACSV